MSTATVIKDKKKITILANQTKTPSSESSVPNETAGGKTLAVLRPPLKETCGEICHCLFFDVLLTSKCSTLEHDWCFCAFTKIANDSGSH